MKKPIYLFAKIKIFLSSILGSCVFLFGCSTTPPSAPAVKPVTREATEKPRPVTPPFPPRHELGSLWSEASEWNNFYSSNTYRKVGTVVLLKPSESFLSLVSKKREGSSSSPENSFSFGHGENPFVVTIKQVLPERIYAVRGEQRISRFSKERKITLVGKLRERDISSEDTATTDQLFDMNVEVMGDETEGPQKTLLAKGDKPKEVPSKDKPREAVKADK